LKKSIEFAKRFPVRRAIFYNLIPFPSTELLEYLRRNNYLAKPIEFILNSASYYKDHPCFSTPEMSLKDRKKAFKMGLDTYIGVRRKFIERKINGPTPLKKLISFIYARPFIEEIVMNSRLMLSLKNMVRSILSKEKIQDENIILS